MRRLRRKPSSFRLTLALRSRLSWTRWSLKRAERRLTREQRRLELMLQQQDSQLLLLKELEERQYQLGHRLEEMAESRSFRETPPALLPPEFQVPLAEQLVEETRKARLMAGIPRGAAPDTGLSPPAVAEETEAVEVAAKAPAE